ncbi:FAD-binding oxidoreductase [Tundrisphaera lichenicola]|uniref:FAD-binding oxidoreductase n=1 Tax=Tundrisphaera lichenicola TaxID=2029860 RepID=UPI003EB9E28F
MDWPQTSAGGTLGDGRFASATDRPSTLSELGPIVARRVGEGLAIYPQGGLTALDYGGTPRSPGVAIDLRGLDRVIDYPAADMTITVEAGITLGRLRSVLSEQGQRLCVEAPEASQATLGGIYATDTSGPRRFGQGRPRDQIIGVSYVDVEGELVKGGGRVVKNVAGYDLPKLLTGSMGTLGIIAELTLKVRPKPEASSLAWVRFRRLAEASQAIERLNTSGTRPVALELLNAPAARRVGRMGDLPIEEWVLVVGFEDNAASVAWQVDRLSLELGRTDIVVRQGDDAEPLWSALVESQAASDGPLTFLTNLKPSFVPVFLQQLDPGRWEIQAHAGNGIVRGHAFEETSIDSIGHEIERLRAEARRLGASLTLPRCPTDWKDPLRVWGDPRSDWAMAERVKSALDPAGVLNPGRFVGKI